MFKESNPEIGLTRRQLFQKTAAAIAAEKITQVAKLPVFNTLGFGAFIALDSGVYHLPDDDQIKLKGLTSKLDLTESPYNQEVLLTQLSQLYLQEYKYFVNRANQLVIVKDPDYQTKQTIKRDREQARFLLERGVVLLNGWGQLGYGDKPKFDKHLRLEFDKQRLSINENVFDFHLALNLINIKLTFLTEPDPQLRNQLKDDYDDLLKLAKLKPEVVISPKSFVIMSQEPMLALTRVVNLLDRHNIVLPSKFTFDPDSSAGTNTGGSYDSNAEVRFPEGHQIVKLTHGFSGNAIYHEIGHYLADLARVKDRIIGLKKEHNFPNHQVEFNKKVVKAQIELYTQTKKIGLIDPRLELTQFITDYAATNPGEDFAETFMEYCYHGGSFRRKLELLEEENPVLARVLKTKYDYIKVHLLKGEEFSEAGKPTKINYDDTGSADHLYMNDLVRFIDEVSNREKKFWQSQERFNQAQVSIRFSGSDLNYQLFLLQSKVWSDIIGDRFDRLKSISGVYNVGHLEARGRLRIVLPQPGGDSFTVDTNNPTSIEQAVKVILGSHDKFLSIGYFNEYSEDNKRSLASLGLSTYPLAHWGWVPSYPPKFVDFSAVYLHFQQRDGSAKWETVPLDVRVVQVSQETKNEFGESKIFSGTFYPIRVDQKDIIISITSDGKLRDVYVNGLEIPKSTPKPTSR